MLIWAKWPWRIRLAVSFILLAGIITAFVMRPLSETMDLAFCIFTYSAFFLILACLFRTRFVRTFQEAERNE